MTTPTIEDAYNEINARGIPENFIQYCQYIGLLDKYRQCNFSIATFCLELRITSPYATPMARRSLLRLFNAMVLQNLPFSSPRNNWEPLQFDDILHALYCIGDQYTATEVKAVENEAIAFIAANFKSSGTFAFAKLSVYNILTTLAAAMSYRDMSDYERIETIKNIIRIKPNEVLPGPAVPVHASFIGLTKEELNKVCSKKPDRLWRICPGKTAAVLEVYYQYTDIAGVLEYWDSLYGSLLPSATYYPTEDGVRRGIDWTPFMKQLRNFKRDYETVGSLIVKQVRRNRGTIPSERPLGDLSTVAVERVIHLL